MIRTLHQRQWTPGTANSKRLRVEFLPSNQTESRVVNAHTVCDSSLKKYALLSFLIIFSFFTFFGSLIRQEQNECFNLAVSVPKNLQSHPASTVNLLDQSKLSNFRFPAATLSVIRRISSHLLKNPHFYQHVLLLMLKLGLKPPFDEDNPCEEQLEDNLDAIFLSSINLPPTNTTKRAHADLVESDESELETDEVIQPESTQIREYHHEPKRRKPTKKLKIGFVGEKADSVVVKTPSDPKALTTTIEEAFEEATPLKPKTFAIKVATNTSLSQVIPEPSLLIESSHELDDSGHFGTLEPPISKPESPKRPTISFDLATLSPEDIISDSDLVQNCIPRPEWIHHKVFAGFKLNPLCNRLYVKNLHKSNTLRDLYCLFGKFIQLHNQDHINRFVDVLCLSIDVINFAFFFK